MQKQDAGFDERELGREESVENGREQNDTDCQQRAMVLFPDVAFHVQGYEALNDASCHETDAGQVDLPADGREPAW